MSPDRARRASGWRRASALLMSGSGGALVCDEVAWFPTPGSRGKVKLEHQNDKGWPWVLRNSPAVGGSCHLSAGPQHS